MKLVAHNVAATGQPTISGGAQLDKTLAAETDEIEEPNALPTNPMFTYQWVRVDGSSNETTISGATSSTYTLTTSDVGHTVKVKVSFTDFRGNAEGPLTSDVYPAKGAVAPAASPCPAVNDWCATMTVADAEGNGVFHGYEFDDKFGSLTNNQIQYDGQTHTVWTVHTVIETTEEYIYFGSDPLVPRDTVVTFDEYTLRTDAESKDGSTGDKWAYPPGELPTDLVWSDGQEVTVSVRFPSPCEDLANRIIVKNLTGEITEVGETNLHKIRLDPFKSYLIEVIGVDGRDMLDVEEHPNLTLEDPEILAIRNARGGSVLDQLATPNNKGRGNNAIASFKKTEYKFYNIEVGSGDNGTGTYQFKIRLNNLCRIEKNGDLHYNWFGGPRGYNPLETAGDTSTNLSLYIGTDYGSYVSRSESHAFLGNNWDPNPDEDWFAVDLEQGEEYTVRLRTKNSLPERLQATQLKILGLKDEDGNAISGTASAGAAGKKVFVTDWTAPSTGRFYIAVGSEGTDRTGTYWLSITKTATN